MSKRPSKETQTFHALHEEKRVAAAMRSQDYDANPPRCGTCLYFKFGPSKKHQRMHPANGRPNERCTFGNFPVTYKGVCNEWRNAAGESIAAEPPATVRMVVARKADAAPTLEATT